jgi:hypothetical protein
MNSTLNPSRLMLAGAIIALSGMLSACSPKVTCEDTAAVDKMLELAKRGVVADLAGQCTRELFEKIPAVAARCPTDSDGSQTQCITACRGWAESSVSAKAGAIDTLFQDDTVATRRCRAAVRFEVAYDGGQVVDSRITYLVAPAMTGVQVVLSE